MINALQASLSLNMSKSKSGTSQVTYNNSALTAQNGDITINSLNDTNIKGANILSQNTEINSSNDLNIESLQNSYTDKSKSFGVNLGVGAGISGGGNVSGGINYSRSSTDRLWTDNQTSIIGTNSVKIDTGNDTDVKGAATHPFFQQPLPSKSMARYPKFNTLFPSIVGN